MSDLHKTIQRLTELKHQTGGDAYDEKLREAILIYEWGNKRNQETNLILRRGLAALGVQGMILQLPGMSGMMSQTPNV